jgi:hypothetical protein
VPQDHRTAKRAVSVSVANPLPDIRILIYEPLAPERLWNVDYNCMVTGLHDRAAEHWRA